MRIAILGFVLTMMLGDGIGRADDYPYQVLMIDKVILLVDKGSGWNWVMDTSTSPRPQEWKWVLLPLPGHSSEKLNASPRRPATGHVGDGNVIPNPYNAPPNPYTGQGVQMIYPALGPWQTPPNVYVPGQGMPGQGMPGQEMPGPMMRMPGTPRQWMQHQGSMQFGPPGYSVPGFPLSPPSAPIAASPDEQKSTEAKPDAETKPDAEIRREVEAKLDDAEAMEKPKGKKGKGRNESKRHNF